MTPDEAFLQDIIAHPDDDTARLIYADWLDEHGQPERGEFIRVQCALASLSEEDDRRWPLLAREKALLAAHEEEWRRPFDEFFSQILPQATLWSRMKRYFGAPPEDGQPRVTGKFERGFLQAISFGQAHLLEALHRYSRIQPLQCLELTMRDAGDERWLYDCSLEFPSVRRLHLRTWTPPGTRESMRQVSFIFPELRHLQIDGIEICADPPRENWLCHLHSLKVGCSPAVSTQALVALLAGLTEGSLSRLHISGGSLGLNAVRALILSPGYERIQSLGLIDSRMSDAELDLLVTSPRLRQLRELSLSGSFLHDERARSLAGSEFLCNLHSLDVSRCAIGWDGLSALAHSRHLSGLHSLILSSRRDSYEKVNYIGDQGACILARTPCLTKLTRLELQHSEIGAEGVEALASSEAMSGLRILDLRGNDIGDRGLRALLDSPHLNHLQDLRLDLAVSGSAWARREIRRRFKDAVN
jgi:uncharacterized protein (TIGR02996 family)